MVKEREEVEEEKGGGMKREKRKVNDGIGQRLTESRPSGQREKGIKLSKMIYRVGRIITRR